MKFLANENFPLRSVEHLRDQGLDIVAVAEEAPGATDPVVLRRAREEGRIVLTYDRDYGELIYRLGLSAPAGISYFRAVPLSPEQPAARLLELTRAGEIEFEGRFTVVEASQIRQRLLPQPPGTE